MRPMRSGSFARLRHAGGAKACLRPASASVRPTRRTRPPDRRQTPADQGDVRLLLQRVTRADVRVDGESVGRIGPGLLVLVGVGPDDEEAVARTLADKVVNLRIFRADGGLMNRSLRASPDEATAAYPLTLLPGLVPGLRTGFL